MKQKADILDLIKSKSLMTISSVTPAGLPQSALIGFAETETFELIFRTSNVSRKYQNITHNPNVAIVIGWDNAQTVQYEGTARELAKADINEYSELYFKKNPHLLKFKGAADEAFFLVTPKWVRYTSLLSDPWDVVTLPF